MENRWKVIFMKFPIVMNKLFNYMKRMYSMNWSTFRWVKWKTYLRISEVFKNSNMLKSVSLKQKVFLVLLLSLLRDMMILILVYFILLGLFKLNIGYKYIVYTYIILNLIPDFEDSKKAWKWEYYAKDKEWALSCTPISLRKLKRLYFYEEIFFKLYSYFTGLIPITIIVLYLCKVSLINSIIFSVILFIYKIICTFVFYNLFNVINNILTNKKSFKYVLSFYIIMATLFLIIGIKIGNGLAYIFNSIPFIQDGTFNIVELKNWGIWVLDEIKDNISEPVNFLYNSKAVWNYISNGVLENRMESVFLGFTVLIIIGFISNSIITILESKIKFKKSESINVRSLESIYLKVVKKYISIFKSDKHILSRIKLVFRNPAIAQKPVALFINLKDMMLLGVFLGFLNDGVINNYLINFIIIEIGIQLSKKGYLDVIEDFKNVLLFDTEDQNISLYITSGRGCKYLFNMKCNIIRLLSIPKLIVIYFVVIYFGRFNLIQITTILILCLGSMIIYPKLALLPGVIAPHFKTNNQEQRGRQLDQQVALLLVDILQFFLEDFLVLIPFMVSLHYIPDSLCFPIVLIFYGVVLVLTLVIVDKLIEYYSSKIVINEL